MMREFDFDAPVERRGTWSYKWHGAEDNDVIPLWVADMDFCTAPPVVEALQRRAAHGVFGYVAVPDEFYNAAIGWFHRRHGWDIEREWIQYTTGVVPAVSVVIKALTRPGDKVLMLTPIYNCFFSCIRNNGCEIEESPLIYRDDATYAIDWEDLDCRLADPAVKVLLFCNPHNPACRVWSAEELSRVGNMCIRHNVRIISDEIHCELVMPGHRYTPFGSVSSEIQNQVITCVSPSKSFNTAGLQAAIIVCNDAELRAKIDRAINDNEVCDLNPFGVEAFIAAYNHGEPWLDGLCRYIQTNFNWLRDELLRHLPMLRITPLDGTYLMWVNCSALGMDGDQMTQFLMEKAHVQVNPGSMYGESGKPFIRINLATQLERLQEAARRMVAALAAR